MGFYCKCFRFEGGGRHTLGLKRTGKSCRLRWVNYLHPGLKRGKMTPHEEKLVLELHSQYGNRWSRIARKLPGRTDNEIKNYWRTHMRKKAQQKKLSSSSPSSNSSSSSLSSGNLADSDYKIDVAIETTTPTTTTTPSESAFSCLEDMEIMQEEVYSMDEIWKDISSSGEVIKPMFSEQATIASPLWEYDSLWQIDGQESRMFNSPFSDAFLPC